MSKTQLYRWFDKDDNLLYVGISFSAVHRAKEHSKTSHWYDLAVKMTLENYESREAALKAECLAIHTENPLHNKARNQSYLLFKEYGFDNVAEFIEHRNKRQIRKSKENNLAKMKKEREDLRMKNLVNACEFLVFYKDNWETCRDKNKISVYPRWDMEGVKRDFTSLLEKKYGKRDSWFECAKDFARFRNSKERLRMYTEYKEVCRYENKELGIREIDYCDYDAAEVLCEKAVRILDAIRKGIVIVLPPQRRARS